MASPFEVLGVDPDADDGEVVQAYRERVKEAHPDHGGSPAEFRAVQTAYERIQAGYDPDAPGDRSDWDVETDERGPDEPSDVGDRDPDREDGGERADEDAEETGVRVEYLDYEVLADHGWDLGDDDLFEKAADAGLDPVEYGRFVVPPGQSLLEAAEGQGFTWPYACRGGACTNCAVAVIEGEMPTPASHVLPQGLIDKGIRLSCLAAPITDDTKVVYNVKHLPGVNELLLPASRFEGATSTD